MSLHTAHLQGAPEDPAETLRALIARHWPAGADPRPVIMSRYGTGDAAADYAAPVTANDRKLAMDGGALVYVRLGAATPETYNNDFVEIHHTVYIDIFADHPTDIERLKNDVDDIIATRRPNTSTRIPKSGAGAEASGLVALDPLVPDWTYIDAVDDQDIREQYAGELTAVTQKSIA